MVGVQGRRRGRRSEEECWDDIVGDGVAEKGLNGGFVSEVFLLGWFLEIGGDVYSSWCVAIFLLVVHDSRGCWMGFGGGKGEHQA